jgi:thiamine-monophosphate kinase
MGDDAAAVRAPPGFLLLASDILVEGTHFDLSFSTPADAGWKAVAANVSDIAAMGGRPLHLLVSVAGPPRFDVEALYEGIADAAREWRCAVVGGDLANGPVATVAVAITGTTDGLPPVCRSGARAGDHVLVTGPLGAAAAQLRALRRGDAEHGWAHRRPTARVVAGRAAAEAGATAMIDVSDGLAADLGHILDASLVGVRLDRVPVHADATLDDALGGGDDYELVICAPDPGAVVDVVVAAGEPEPQVIGRCTEDPGERLLAGAPMPAGGWEHQWG